MIRKVGANDPVKNGRMEWIAWDWLQKRTYYKRSLFLSTPKDKGTDVRSQANLYKGKKNGINLKRIWYQPSFDCQLLQISFKNVSSLYKFKTDRTLCRNTGSIILTPRSSTCLLRKLKAGYPLHNKSFIDFTDPFGSVELIFRIFNLEFSLKC